MTNPAHAIRRVTVLTALMLGAFSVATPSAFATPDTPFDPATLCGTLPHSIDVPTGTFDVNCAVRIPANVALALNPGSALRMGPAASITVDGGTLAASAVKNGTAHEINLFPSGATTFPVTVKSGTLFANNAGISGASISGTPDSLVLANSSLLNSPVTLTGGSAATIESNTFTASPVSLTGVPRPIIGGNTFTGSGANPLTVAHASDTSGIGTDSTPAAAVSVTDSTVTGAWGLNAGTWNLANDTVAPSGILTVVPGVTATLSGPLSDNGLVQMSRLAADAPISFTGSAGTAITGSGTFFANGVSLTGVPVTATGNVTIVNSALTASPVATTASVFGPVIESDTLTASPVSVTGGRPVIGGNVFTSTTTPLTVTAAADLSGLGGNTLPVATTAQVSGLVTGRWTVFPGAWTFAGVTVAAGAITTPVPGAAISLSGTGVTVSGVFQAARNSSDAALTLAGTPAAHLTLASGGTLFLNRVSAANVVFDATGDGHVTVVNSAIANSSFTYDRLSAGPAIESNTLTATPVTVTNSSKASVGGNIIK